MIANLSELPFDSLNARMRSPGSPTASVPALTMTSPGRRPDSFAGVPTATLITNTPGVSTPASSPSPGLSSVSSAPARARILGPPSTIDGIAAIGVTGPAAALAATSAAGRGRRGRYTPGPLPSIEGAGVGPSIVTSYDSLL